MNNAPAHSRSLHGISNHALLALAALFIGASATNARAATFSDENWMSMGGYPGANGSVYATVVDASGNLYIGGTFSIAGDAFATNIAKWDGTNWSALGTGLQWIGDWGIVYALAVSGNDLYAAGSFTNAGGVAASSIAKWNGTNWSALGSGLAGGPWGPYVYALAVSGSDLYVGGSFATAGGNAASNIAQWDGSNWSAVGSGMDGTVNALVLSGGDLYAGGRSTNAGGVTVNGIAKWNGSSWSALGSGVNGSDFYDHPAGYVTGLAVSGNDLYVTGFFSRAGSILTTNMAKWNGSSWSAFPWPIYGRSEQALWGDVNDLTISGDDLYAAGVVEISLGGGASYYDGYVVKWNGTSWSPLGSVTFGVDSWDSDVTALAVSGSNVYSGGPFRRVGNKTALGIAKWNGTDWSALAPAYQYLTALTASGRDVYGAGLFANPDGTPSNYVAKWTGSGWSPLGSEFQPFNTYGSAYGSFGAALVVSGGDLYAGGSFTNAGGTPANGIAKWNGTNWSALGSGLGRTSNSTPRVNALAVSGNDLYVGGRFILAGGIPATNIAKWDGTNWSALDSGIGPRPYEGSSWVSALAVLGNNLYAGGIFTTAGGIPANCIARWDGSSWSALGSGVGGSGSAPAYVTALAVLGNDLYAGGWFTTAGGVIVRCVAKWDGTNWSSLSGGMAADNWSSDGEHNSTPYVYALAVSGNNLYVGGNFNTAGDASANYIARWNGGNWFALGSGTDDTVGLLTATDSELFAMGGFQTAGRRLSPNLARARIGVAAQRVSASSSAVSIRFSGVTGYPHDVQRATNLTPPVAWTTINGTPLYPAADGSFTITDTNAAHGTAFYRASAIGLGPVACPRIGLQEPAGNDLSNGDSADFGALTVGNSVTKTFTITNSGAGPLIIHYVGTFSASLDFVVDTTGMLTNVPAGGSTTFAVTFSPTSAGSKSEELDVYFDTTECYEPNEGWFTITVNGTGL